MGLGFLRADARAVLDAVFGALARGEGGLLLTANLDILRRYVRDADARSVYARATITVADGAPIVWASRVAGTPLPERVAGASLVPLFATRAAREGRSLFLLGGEGDDAANAANAFSRASPTLRVAGVANPRVSYPPSEDDVRDVAATLRAAQPDLVLVAMGSPKQEALAAALAPSFPSTWFVGVGASLAFASGRVTRAPGVLQRVGLEWAHRLATEPTRLARRYLVEGLPFAVVLFADALRTRASRARS